jgi:hypothetical protein
MNKMGGIHMKTRIKRFGAVLVAVLALTLAMFPAGSALADDPTEHSNQANITVSKTLETLQSGIFPNVTSFQFLLEPVMYTPGPTSAGSIAYTAANLPMPGGTTGPQAITINGFSPTAPGTTQTLSTTTSNITYVQAGVYTYRLTERIPGTTDALGTVPGSPVAGVEYDETVYYVNVYVGNVLNDDGTVMLDGSGHPVVNVYAITAWETNNTSNTDPTQPDNNGNPPIPNHPGELDDGKIGIVIPDDNDGDPRNISYPFVNDYNTASLVVTKLVSGYLADPNLGFSFILNLVRPAGGADTTNYPYQIYDMGADRAVGGTDDTAVSGGTGNITNGGSFTLKHNQYIQIIGLPTGERVTTTEQGTTDYRTTITVQHGNPGTLTTVRTDVTTNKTTNQQIIVTGENAVNQQNFNNKKESIMPTGVLLDVLPYALLLAVGIAGVALVFRKRRVNEQ